MDCVFIAESAEPFRAAGREQFYVSVSRFKEGLTIYTDDKQQLLEAVTKSSHRPSATDLVGMRFPETFARGATERHGVHEIRDEGIEEGSKQPGVLDSKTVPARRTRPIRRQITPSHARSISR